MHQIGVGSSIGGYEIIERVGAGGMGYVYRARQTRLERIVALKVIRPEIAMQETFRSRFIRESQLAASLEHPNVVPVYEAGDDHETLFMAMRWVTGPDLRRMFAWGPLSPDVTLPILCQLAAALDAAHEIGLVHRDVKPANVLTEGSRIYLTDFGLARSLVLAADERTAPGGFAGTLDYAAPELLDGGDGGARADNYSLACLTFEALCGSVPFPGDGVIAKLRAHHDEPTPQLTRLRPDLPPALDAVFADAMSVDPAGRPASATGFAEQVRAALTAGGNGAPARTDGTSSEAGVSSAETAPASRPATPAIRRVSARRVMVGLVVLAAVAAAVAAAVLALTGTFSDGHRVRPSASGGRGGDARTCDAQEHVRWTRQPVQRCPLTAPLSGSRIPVYARPATNQPGSPGPHAVGALHGTDGQRFVCQQRFASAEYVHPRGWRNRWWAYTLSDDDHWGWVPEVFFSGGANDQADGTLRPCPARLPRTSTSSRS